MRTWQLVSTPPKLRLTGTDNGAVPPEITIRVQITLILGRVGDNSGHMHGLRLTGSEPDVAEVDRVEAAAEDADLRAWHVGVRL